MRTYLLSWNPNNWEWDYLQRSIDDISRQGFNDDYWSSGNRRDVDIGDSFFLIRLGREPRGIVGSGFITSDAFDAPHWAEARATRGDTSIYVGVRFNALVEAPLISITELEVPPFSSVHWHTQSSGILIRPDIAESLTALWRERLGQSDHFVSDRPFGRSYTEGLRQTSVTSAYERSATAREACIAHHGYSCACCDVLLESVYGAIAKEFIHVHHLEPLSKDGKQHTVNPARDLVPVCPTCHAIIHRRAKPLTVEEVRILLGNAAGKNHGAT